MLERGFASCKRARGVGGKSSEVGSDIVVNISNIRKFDVTKQLVARGDIFVDIDSFRKVDIAKQLVFFGENRLGPISGDDRVRPRYDRDREAPRRNGSPSMLGSYRKRNPANSWSRNLRGGHRDGSARGGRASVRCHKGGTTSDSGD